MDNKTNTICQMAKQKSKRRRQEVIDEINSMAKEGIPITFYSVAKRTGAAKSFLYRNEEISRLIQSYRSNPPTIRSDDSKDVLIKALQKRVAELEKTIAAMSKSADDSYKSKYERLREENKELRAQLRTAYKY